MRRTIYFTFGLLLIALLQTACGLLGDVPLPEVLGTATPLPTPTPLGSTLEYAIADGQYDITLGPSQSVPGTQLVFIGKPSDTIYTVSIDGLAAGKQDGDSFIWQGIIGPGVTADYRLNLLPTYAENILRANGNVFLTIFEPTPIEQLAPQPNDQMLRFENMTLDYLVPIGGTVPGTTLVYEGEANDVVTFSGTQGVPTYVLGDSVLWNGFLRDNIYVQNNLELKQVEVNGLRIGGSTTLWIYRTPLSTTP